MNYSPIYHSLLPLALYARCVRILNDVASESDITPMQLLRYVKDGNILSFSGQNAILSNFNVMR